MGNIRTCLKNSSCCLEALGTVIGSDGFHGSNGFNGLLTDDGKKTSLKKVDGGSSTI